MYPFRSPRYPMQIPYQRPYLPPTQHLTRLPMGPMNNQPSGLGGLLSKILGGRATSSFNGGPGMGFPPANMPGMFGMGSQSGVGAQGITGMLRNSFSSAGGITGMLDNVQRVMGVAQQFGPMIQQYGPFIKNMPAMLKIMKELNSSESDSEETTANTEMNELPEKELPDFEDLQEGNTKKPLYGESLPKLFI
ncbi:VrrA/YqfQ family protein [Bacillus sp. Marseille-P3661]|uniref:VrrA/YqfQ family protein n=1 Tax=Bacillus sp. Marseille-P3661 TaxID=1936234 RepID=UPI0015E172DD|nr:VrrA/YqfQ family protein [Bacillus sp. Marseille-P3661]